MSTFKTTLDCGAIGEWTVTVGYDYQPFEAATATYPGCDEQATINWVSLRSGLGSITVYGITKDDTLTPEAREQLRIEALEHEAGKRELAEERKAQAREDYYEIRAQVERGAAA
jgi:hypothetical protein